MTKKAKQTETPAEKPKLRPAEHLDKAEVHLKALSVGETPAVDTLIAMSIANSYMVFAKIGNNDFAGINQYAAKAAECANKAEAESGAYPDANRRVALALAHAQVAFCQSAAGEFMESIDAADKAAEAKKKPAS